MGNKDMTKNRRIFTMEEMPVVFHPGEILEEKLQELGMGVKEFAIRVSKPEKTIIAVIKGKSSITPDMAVSFELVTKIPASMWLRHQKSYDEYMARQKREQTFKEGLQWVNKFPIEEIEQLGWLPDSISPSGVQVNIVDRLCKFFAVSSPKGWEDFYLNQKLRVCFRITLSESCDPYALSVWLRQGEIQASEMNVSTKYNPRLLRGILSDLLRLINSGEGGSATALIQLLNSVGVKLIITPTLSTAPMKGCTRYINSIPCIQLAKDFSSYNDFSHTFFHEIGHILLHGKKEIFIENTSNRALDSEKEAEADQFADKLMMTPV